MVDTSGISLFDYDFIESRFIRFIILNIKFGVWIVMFLKLMFRILMSLS